MSFKNNSTMVIGYLVLILVVGLCAPNASFADDDMPELRSSESGEGDEFDPETMRAEEHFHVVGTLNAVDGDHIVIENSRLDMSGGASLYGVSKYDEVGALLNADGEVIAIERIKGEGPN